MGQRTQTLVKLTDTNGESNSFAYHNQRGFGRPLVTGTLSVVLDALLAIEDGSTTYRYNEDRIKSALQRPLMYNNGEFFDYHEPYGCSFPFSHNDHDNDDGYAEIWIDLQTNRVDFKFFDYDGVEKSALKYIKDELCEDYCDQERQERYVNIVKEIASRVTLPNNPTIKHAESML